MTRQDSSSEYSLSKLVWYFFLLGTIGFGGAYTLANMVYKDLVERKKWITKAEYQQALAFTQFAPGPLVTQLAMYIGYLKGSIVGSLLAGVAFFTTPALSILFLTILYQLYGNLAWMKDALYTIGAAVIGIIIASTYSLIRKTIQKKLLWGIFFTSALLSFISGKTNFYFLVGAGLIAMFLYAKKLPRLPFLSAIPFSWLTISTGGIFWQLFVFFFSSGLLAFGGGFAVLSYMQTGVVSQYHWLTNKQFLDGVAIAMITPGPVILASTFVGYLVGNIFGAFVGTLAVFLPAFGVVIVFAPILKKYSHNQNVEHFVEGVVAAALGAVMLVIFALGKESIIDISTLLIATISALLVRFLKIPSFVVVVVAGIVGVFFLHAH